jgi:hypothetical protein
MLRKKIKKIFENIEIVYIIPLIIGISLIISYFSLSVYGGSGQNVTVITTLNVGNVPPEILNISINDYQSINLIPNSTRQVQCIAYMIDYNNDSDFQSVNARFFNSTYGTDDDNNDHYTNSSCDINRTFGTWKGYSDNNYTAIANCTFNVWYYANPNGWNCTVWVNDTTGLNSSLSNTININELLAVSLPDSIDYGTVNVTYVSLERHANVSNAGNVFINLSLDGYAVNRYDNLSMNCSLGQIKNISIMYEKFNLTQANTGIVSLTQFELFYKNLTSKPSIQEFNLRSRIQDSYDDAVNASYWRIYVPIGVGGTCAGNIVFGATKAAAN